MTLSLVPPESSTPPQPKKSLSQIFNQFAADAVQRFPHLQGRLIVADMNERKVYGHNEVDEKKTGFDSLTVREHLRDHPVTQEMQNNKDMSSCALPGKLSIIFSNESFSQVDNISRKEEEHLLFVLDHELAHCAIKDGAGPASSPRDYKILLGESVADAYALLRHYQRYGANSTSENRMISPSGRADNFVVWGDSTHFTSFVLDAIAKRKHEIDFEKLTPQQTAELARRFALQYMPPERVVQDLQFTFGALQHKFLRRDEKGKIVKNDPEGGIKALIEKALDPASDYYTFKMASLWLKPFLEERTFMDGTPIGLPKEYLDDAQVKLKGRAAQFEKEDILFNMPIKQPKAQAPKIAA